MATCPVCGTQTTGITCSRACRGKWVALIRKPREARTRNCSSCGRPVLTKGRSRVFCEDCRHPERVCAQCGETYRARSSRPTKVCSLQCGGRLAIAKRVFPDGPRHYLWKGGTPHYRGPKWPQISRRIRERDNYTCQNCRRAYPDVQLGVHHIERPDDPSDWAAVNVPENLTTLCDECHAHEHKGFDVETSEERRAYHRAYYQRNRDKSLAQSAEWQRTHREQRREINRRYYERKRARAESGAT